MTLPMSVMGGACHNQGMILWKPGGWRRWLANHQRKWFVNGSWSIGGTTRVWSGWWRLWFVIGRWFGNNESFIEIVGENGDNVCWIWAGECRRVILNESKEGRTKARIGTKEKMSESKEWLWESMAVDSMESLDSFPYSWYLYPAKMRRKWGWSWAGWVWQ